MFTLAFTRRFSMSHRLLSPRAAKCGIPHGHNELVTVQLGLGDPLLDYFRRHEPERLAQGGFPAPSGWLRADDRIHDL